MLTDEEKKQRRKESYQRWKENNPESYKKHNKNINRRRTNSGYYVQRYAEDREALKKKWRDYYAANKDEINKRARARTAEKSPHKDVLAIKESLLKNVSVYDCFNMVRGL